MPTFQTPIKNLTELPCQTYHMHLWKNNEEKKLGIYVSHGHLKKSMSLQESNTLAKIEPATETAYEVLHQDNSSYVNYGYHSTLIILNQHLRGYSMGNRGTASSYSSKDKVSGEVMQKKNLIKSYGSVSPCIMSCCI